MKKIVLFSLVLGFSIVQLAGLHQPAPANEATWKEIIDQLSRSYWEGIDSFAGDLEYYREVADQFAAGATDAETLQRTHLRARLKFKELEFLMEYFDHDAVETYINGAPLPSVMQNNPQVYILEPEGLQVLDELVFAEDPFEEKEAIREMVELLIRNFSTIKRYQVNVPIEHRFVFEASRKQLIRIFTLGLTGFDTPGSLNAIPEAKTALASVQRAIGLYLPLLEKNEPRLAEEITTLLDDGVQYLETHQDFEDFDRLYYLTAFINPLYGKLYGMQRALEIEVRSEVTSVPVAVNEEAENIFADDFLNTAYFFNSNARSITKKRIELGKLLFFDPVLSSNNERSCASCHNPELAFTDGLDKSMAIHGKGKILRNAPTLINAIYSDNYFLDLREPLLERQIKHVVVDSLEFNTSFFDIVDKLGQSNEYRRLFAEAYSDYPEYQLSKWSVSDALAVYVASLTSFNSSFDQYVRGEIAELPEAVKNGFNLFMGKASCGTCHFAPTFNGIVPPQYQEMESEVLGVPATKDTLNPQIDPDWGRRGNSRPLDGVHFYQHSFKTTTVRNVKVTGPYMHNGVYQTLEEVIDFYNKGGGLGLGIDIPHQTLPDAPLNLNEKEVSDLIAFMEALTDYERFAAEIPKSLPQFEGKPEWNSRSIGGVY